MATKRDYYEVLGLKREASTEEINKSYRELAKRYHPDRNSHDEEATQKFREVAEAYEVLRDPEKRQRYDRYGHAGLEGVEMPDFSNMDVLSRMFGDLFENFFGGGGRRGPRAGRDVRASVELDLVEAARGVTKQVQVRRADICTTCRGTGETAKSRRERCGTCRGRGVLLQSSGFMTMQRPCPTCQGQGAILTNPCEECEGHGLVIKEVMVPANIPAGVDSNMELTVEAQGHAGERGAPRGDLRVEIVVLEHPIFQRHNDDLVCQAIITYPQAALGCTIEVPTVEGKTITHTLPRGTQSHEIVTIPGQGMPSLRGRRRGNLLVQVLVETPRQLTKRQEELMREMAEMDDKNVSPQRKSWLDKVKSFFSDGAKK
jgi:molecular chaperone DnaJ